MNYGVYLTMMTLMWGLIAILGGTVAIYSLLAWRRQHSKPMLALGVGLLLLSVVPAVMWLGLYSVTDDIYSTTMYCTGVMMTGFALLLVSVTTRAA
jgi:hypothetical protein